jgi:hypothetical protein
MNCVASLLNNTDDFCLFSREFFPSIGRNVVQSPICVPIVYDFSLKFILLIMWKILKYIGYEYYGICAEKSSISVVSGVA